MVEVLCIDNYNRPDEIPRSKWIQFGFKYHITHVYFHPMQGVQGVDLAEVKLTPDCFPYETYKLSRFAITMENYKKLLELAKSCTELNVVDIDKLLEESKLQLIDDK